MNSWSQQMSFQCITRNRFSQGNIIYFLVHIYLMIMLFVSIVTRYTICLHNWHCHAVLLLTAPWHDSPTQGEIISWGWPTSISIWVSSRREVSMLITKDKVSSTMKIALDSLDTLPISKSSITLIMTYETNRKANVRP